MPAKFTVTSGQPLPFGATISGGAVNFSLFSRHAQQVSLLLYQAGRAKEVAEIPLHPINNRTGDIWHLAIEKLDLSYLYAFRLQGPYEPRGAGHMFQAERILIDPYAKALAGGEKWGITPGQDGWRCVLVEPGFDWEGDRPLNIPLQKSIIYEMHVRGFTRGKGSGVKHPGTYQGVIEKIPYLKELGITAVELMPVTEFDENENINQNPSTGERLKNFWGYSPIAFFAPKASYAVNGFAGRQVTEFKRLVKALHKAGIEVILDIVFNHTGEGDHNGPTLSFRGIDNTIYYLLDRGSRNYLNFSGCGNTLNCNHPLVRSFIIECLHYWVMEMHVDGFRFDLASILGRDQNGEVLINPPMVEQIAEDPLLANTKIIAEAWDAAGLYQVGHFSKHSRWAEWNGKFRDDVRAFTSGQHDSVAKLATRIAGSSDLYQPSSRPPCNSINFITSHDGFTLYDLVSYNHKHNEHNGEKNQDGDNHNLSWNSGVEGRSRARTVNEIRLRRLKTMAVILFLSQGTPMLVAGDEFCRTQQGNNNAYCQDNEISWLDWRLAQKNAGVVRFFQMLIALRKNHPVFSRADFFSHDRRAKNREIIWQSDKKDQENWAPQCQVLCFLLSGKQNKTDNDFFVILNGHKQFREVEIPAALNGRKWRLIIDTSLHPPHDFISEGSADLLQTNSLMVAGMGAMVLIA